MNRTTPGDLWKSIKDFMVRITNVDNYTLNIPSNNHITVIEPPIEIDGVFIGGHYKEARTGFLHPMRKYIARIEDRSTVTSCGIFDFQLTFRIDGETSYDLLGLHYSSAMDLVSDSLLILDDQFRCVDPSILSIESVEYDPVDIRRADGTTESDWLLLINIVFKVNWLPNYSEFASSNLLGGGVGLGEGAENITIGVVNNIETGLFIAPIRDFPNRVLDHEFTISVDEEGDSN